MREVCKAFGNLLSNGLQSRDKLDPRENERTIHTTTTKCARWTIHYLTEMITQKFTSKRHDFPGKSTRHYRWRGWRNVKEYEVQKYCMIKYVKYLIKLILLILNSFITNIRLLLILNSFIINIILLLILNSFIYLSYWYLLIFIYLSY